MSADPTVTAHRSRTQRSAVSNGSRRFVGGDGRSSFARLLRDREFELAEPLGGLRGLGPSERLRVQAAAALSVRLEAVRTAYANGEADMGITDEDLIRLSNALARELRALERLAAARKAKPGVADLRSYIDAHGEAAA